MNRVRLRLGPSHWADRCSDLAIPLIAITHLLVSSPNRGRVSSP